MILALLIAACGGGIGGSSTATEMMRYAPEGSKAILMVNIKELLNNPSISKRVEKLKLREEYAEAKRDLGLDPFQDISLVMLAGDPYNDTGVIVLSGNFDAEQFAKQLRESQREDRGDYLFEPVGAFLLMGKAKWVESAKASAAKGPLDASPELKAALGSSYAGKTIFGALINLEEIPAADRPEGPLPKGAAIGADARSSINIEMALRFASSEEASTAQKLTAPQIEANKKSFADKGLSSTPTMTASGSDVLVSMLFTQDEVESGMLMFDGFIAAMGL